MPEFLTDENFDGRVFHGLIERRPALDIVRVQDVGLRQSDDPAILTWAAEHGRVLLTKDFRTIPAYAYERVRKMQRMPGVLVIGDALSVGAAIEQITLVIECSQEDEWEGQVRRLPL